MKKLHQNVEMMRRISAKMRSVMHSLKVMPEHLLTALLDSVEKLLCELERMVLPRETFPARRVVVECCVHTREFIDWLHSLSLLTQCRGIDAWRVRFAKLQQRIDAVALPVVAHLRTLGCTVLADQTDCYRVSMDCRKSIASQLSEGMDAVSVLLHRELGGPERVTQKARSQVIADLPALHLINPESEAGEALFFLWKSVRFLRHKLLFAAVEYSHEAGPWGPSIGDHLKINSNTLELAKALLQEARHPDLEDFTRQARHILSRVAVHVTVTLTGLRTRQEDQQFSMDLPGERNADIAEEFKELGDFVLGCYADLECLEEKLRPAVKTHLGHTEIEWTVSPASPEDARKVLAPAWEPYSDDEAIELLDGTLLNGWALDPPYECPEMLALHIFRKLAARNVLAACRYLRRFLDLKPAANVLPDHMALMFAGVLLKAARQPNPNFPGWDQWRELAAQVAVGETAGDHPAAARVALCAALASISFYTAPDSHEVAGQLACALLEIYNSLAASIAPAEDGKQDYFFAHLFTNLEGFPWASGSHLQHLLAELEEHGIPALQEAMQPA